MNKTKKIIVLGACTLMMCGCGKELPTLSDGSQPVVSFNEESDAVSANDLYNSMKENYALDSMLTLMDTKILEKEYPDDLEEAKKGAESTVKAMKDTYGEDYITGYFGSIAAYQNMVYLNSLQQKAILDYVKGKVTENEVESYYEKNIYGDVTVSHILVKTGVTDNTSTEDKTKLESDAKDKINTIIKKLDEAEDKEVTWKELVKEYSEDDTTKDKNGSLGAINTNTLSSSYDEILKAARSLKDGEHSKSVITTELGYHVILRESSSEKPSLDEKKEEIKETLGTEKLNDDATLRITAMDELRKKYGMTINDSELKEKYSNYIANQIAAARNQGTTN